MADDLPDKITVEIEEEDIRKDLNKVLDSMNSIRQIEIDDGNISDEAKDRYLHLSYRLASMLEIFPEDKIQQKLDAVREALNKNNALLNYDFLQADFWKENAPEFDSALDKLLIAVRKENLTSIEEKHHIMQAAKYLLSVNASDDDRMKVYFSILPYSTNSMQYNRGLFKEELKKRDIKNIERGNGLVLKVENYSDLERLVKDAAVLGFKTLNVLTTKRNYDEAKNKYNVTLVRDIKTSGDKAGLEELVGGPSRMQRFCAKVLPPIKFLTYPIVGMAPGYLQRKLENYVGREVFEAQDASFTSSISIILGSAAFMLFQGVVEGTYAVWSWPHLTQSLNVYHLLSALGVLVQEMVWVAVNQEMGSDVFGNLFGKIACAPIELAWRGVDFIKKNVNEDKRNLVMEVSLLNKKQIHGRVNSHFPYLEHLAVKPVSDEAKKSIIWSNKNHYAFGQRFSFELLKEYVKANKQFLDRKNNAFDVYHSSKFGGYCKTDLLACFTEERYLMSLITKKDEPNMEELNKLLLNGEDTKDKLKTIGEISDAEFVRLIKYKSDLKIDDYEVIKW